MALGTTISDAHIQKSIVRAVTNVCQTMLSLEPALEGVDPAGLANGREYVFGCVGFVGDTNGLVYLGIPDQFAKEMTAQILGMSPHEVASQGNVLVNDVIGEFTNITVGGFKNALCDLGLPCKLTLPSIIRGEHVSVAANRGAIRHQFVFSCRGQQILADIQFKNE